MAGIKKENRDELSLVFIVYGNAIDDEMVELLKEHAGGYTKFEGVRGEGAGEPRLGSHVWPGVNNCVMAALTVGEKNAVQKEIDVLRIKFPGAGIRLFILPGFSMV